MTVARGIDASFEVIPRDFGEPCPEGSAGIADSSSPGKTDAPRNDRARTGARRDDGALV
jgi:hypothetical protein